MVEMLKNEIISQGHKSVNILPTRNVGLLSEKESCIDYIITNRIDKMTNHQKYLPNIQQPFSPDI